MKIFLALLLLAPLSALANVSAHFTTVFLDDEGVVYVGAKQGDNPGDSVIVSFPFDSGERTNIPIPEEIAHRDVIGLITKKEKLYVLTNGTGEPGQGPMLHIYDRGRSKWTKMGQIICPTFTKVTLKSTQMIFSCEVGKTRRGKARVERKVISLKKDPIYRGGVWRFPEFMLRYKGRTVLLEGEAPSWDRLRLRKADGTQRMITAQDLLQLPLPATPAQAADAKASESKSTNTATSVQ